MMKYKKIIGSLKFLQTKKDWHILLNFIKNILNIKKFLVL